MMGLVGGGSVQPDLKAVTWNMAAINNNPFEYWITHKDKGYNKLMEDVSSFINAPGDRDVKVSDVFTDAMFADLVNTMNEYGWTGVAETQTRWESEYKNRKIITEFIKDGTLGKKRLASMPDRCVFLSLSLSLCFAVVPWLTLSTERFVNVS